MLPSATRIAPTGNCGTPRKSTLPARVKIKTVPPSRVTTASITAAAAATNRPPQLRQRNRKEAVEVRLLTVGALVGHLLRARGRGPRPTPGRLPGRLVVACGRSPRARALRSAALRGGARLLRVAALPRESRQEGLRVLRSPRGARLKLSRPSLRASPRSPCRKQALEQLRPAGARNPKGEPLPKRGTRGP